MKYSVGMILYHKGNYDPVRTAEIVHILHDEIVVRCNKYNELKIRSSASLDGDYTTNIKAERIAQLKNDINYLTESVNDYTKRLAEMREELINLEQQQLSLFEEQT